MNVPFPLFELVGPKCEDPECKGVLIDTIELKTQDFVHKCSECKLEFHRVPAKEKLTWVNRVIDRALKGEKES